MVGTLTEMYALLLCSLLINVHALKDIVIERPKTPDVDFADLLLEYNPSVPPEVDVPVEVSVSLKILYAHHEKNLFSLTVLFNQSWHDHRLAMAGAIGIPVPAKYANIIWKPPTHFINDVGERALPLLKALHLGKNGEVCLEQKLPLKLPCKVDFPTVIEKNGWTNCSMDLEAFGWSDHVHYRLEGIQYSSDVASVLKLGEGVDELRRGNATSVLSIPISVNTGITTDVLQYILNNRSAK
uniref:Neur_chan_LBD domain-containing protein n=1 Tax=Steinernema glaseri TaxID=37863 RepID=A0A1I7YQ90_9BILA